MSNAPLAGHTVVDPVGRVDHIVDAKAESRAERAALRSGGVVAAAVLVGAAGFAGAFALSRPAPAADNPKGGIQLTPRKNGAVAIVAPGGGGGIPALIKPAPKVIHAVVSPAAPAYTPPSRSYTPPASYTPPSAPRTPVQKPAAKPAVTPKPAAKPTPAPKQTTTYYTTTFG